MTTMASRTTSSWPIRKVTSSASCNATYERNPRRTSAQPSAPDRVAALQCTRDAQTGRIAAPRLDRRSNRVAALARSRHHRDDLHDVVALVGVVGDPVRADETASRTSMQDYEPFV